MLNMMNRGFLPYQSPTGGPATMQFDPMPDASQSFSPASGSAGGVSQGTPSLTPMPSMMPFQPYSQTQSFIQPFSAINAPMSATMSREPRPFFGQSYSRPQGNQSFVNFMARRGYGGYGGGGMFQSVGRRRSTAYGGTVGAAGGSVGGIGDFSGLNPYGSGGGSGGMF